MHGPSSALTISLYTVQIIKLYSLRPMHKCHTSRYTTSHGFTADTAVAPSSGKEDHMTQALAFLLVLLRIYGVHETLRDPPLLSLAHNKLLVVVAEPKAC